MRFHLLPKSRARRRVLSVAGAGYVVGILLIMFGGCADKLILYPQTDPVRLINVQRREVPFEGAFVEVLVARSPGCRGREPQAFMIEYCGNATQAGDIVEFVAERWGDRPVETWVLNYPGYGTSPGKARLAAIAPSALAAYDELKKVAGNRPIFIAGNSIGTTAALHVAANRSCAGTILQNPPALRSLILRYYGWWNLWTAALPVAMQIPSDLDSRHNARKVNAPALFILSDSDEIVRPPNAKLVVDAYAGPKRTIILKGKGHNDYVATREEIAQLQDAMDWLLNSSPAATRPALRPSPDKQQLKPPVEPE
jgi:pimeloyl-ACP methyl ester carboxylesterase